MQYGKQSACLAVALAALAACGAQDSQTGKPGGPTRTDSILLTRKLAEIAAQANQAAPADIDADTRLDGVRAGPGLRLTSSYTLVNARSEGINSATFQAKLAPGIKSASCGNSELRPLIDQGVVVVLEYRGLDGSSIGMMSLNLDTCSAIQPLRSQPAP